MGVRPIQNCLGHEGLDEISFPRAVPHHDKRKINELAPKSVLAIKASHFGNIHIDLHHCSRREDQQGALILNGSDTQRPVRM